MTLPRTYFDELYLASEDPWSFRTRRYEARKRSLTLGVLLEDTYATAFEPGCSIGTLTAELAPRCAQLLAMDISASALATAGAQLPASVTLRQGALPEDWPADPVDLVVLSEVGYYLSTSDCRTVAARAMATSGEVVAVHWRHPVEDYPIGGDEVHALLGEAAQAAGHAHAVQHVEEDLRIDVWAKDPRSVARRTFLGAP